MITSNFDFHIVFFCLQNYNTTVRIKRKVSTLLFYSNILETIREMRKGYEKRTASLSSRNNFNAY